MQSNYSETSKIRTLPIFTLLMLGAISGPVYLMFAFGYWMKRKGWWVVYPYAVAFAVVNTLHNWTVCTLMFREFPKEFFTTSRLRRWKKSEDDSLRELADLLGGLLNRHDDGHY